MAQVVDYYAGSTPTSGDVKYIRGTPNGTGILQLERGATVRMGNLNETDGCWRTFQPVAGWIRTYDLQGVHAVYKTVTDACTPPTSVELNAATKILTIVGGAGGDLNALEGWGISWRDRAMGTSAWGAWTADVVTADRAYAVAAPAGYERQFRAQTRGSAGASYFSAYVECPTLLAGNTMPSAPAITRPTGSGTTHSLAPVVIVSCPAEPDGDVTTLKRQVDGGAWTNAATVPGSGGVVKDRLPTLGSGAHTVRYKLVDPFGLESGQVSVTITVSPAVWARAIAAGTVIANAATSHRADIAELHTAVNVQRAYYGLGEITFPGTVGRFADWKSQMQAMQAGITEALAAAGVAAPAWQPVPGYPAAGVINQLRATVGIA